MEIVTVVIPNYNGKKFLADCLDSLKKQTYRDFRVLVVDNGSTDGSCEFLRNNYPKVDVIELSENTGFANAVNVGIRESNGKYVFLLNNDTICEQGAIEALVKVLDKKARVFSVQAKMLKINEPHNIDDAGDFYSAMGWGFAQGKDKDNKLFSKRSNIMSACAGAAMYRKDYFDKIGLFDEAHFCYLEDIDVGYRARLYGYQNVMEPDAIVYHAGSGSSGSRYNAFKVELTAANNLYFMYKNWNAVQVIINLPLVLLGIIIKHAFYTKKGLGRAHLKGLSKGFSKIFTNSDKRVRFVRGRFARSLALQLELWVNIVKRLA
jgi:GT2 family glycosyltransferase